MKRPRRPCLFHNAFHPIEVRSCYMCTCTLFMIETHQTSCTCYTETHHTTYSHLLVTLAPGCWNQKAFSLVFHVSSSPTSCRSLRVYTKSLPSRLSNTMPVRKQMKEGEGLTDRLYKMQYIYVHVYMCTCTYSCTCVYVHARVYRRGEVHERSVIETRQSKATTLEDNSLFLKRKRRAASGRTRTCDVLHTRQMLLVYQLSHQGSSAGQAESFFCYAKAKSSLP